MDYNDQYLVMPGSDKAIFVSEAKDISLDAAIGTWRTMFGSDSSDTKPSKPYKQVDLVFNCVNKLIDAVVGIPIVLSTLDARAIESGPAWDIIFNNPAMSWQKFITETVGHYALSRDVFWIFIDKQPGRPPREVHVVSGTQMHPITDNGRSDGELIGWQFRGGATPVNFSLEEVYQIKNFNPYDRFHGLGPATASKLNIDYIYAATLFNFASLENGADPGVILTTPGRPNTEEINTLRSMFDARHKGSANAKRTALLTGGMEAKTLAMNMVDMQMAELTNLSGARVCSTFGVPPAMVGLVTEAQYAHGPAQRDFIFNTIIPLCSMLSGELTSGLLGRFSPDEQQLSTKSISGRNRGYRDARRKAIGGQKQLFLWFDTDQHPTVQESTREIAEQTLKFTQSGVPLNELIEAHDLPYDVDKIPWGNDWWIPMGQVPASYITEAGPEGIIGQPLPEGEGEDDTGDEDQGKDFSQTAREIAGLLTEQKTEKADQQRLRLWKNWVISWAGLEREYNAAIRTFFLRQQRLLTDKLKAAFKDQKTISTKADPNEIIARVVFDLRGEDGKLKVIHNTFFGRASELGIRQGLAESAGLAGDAFEAAVDQVQRSSRIGYKRTVSGVKLSKVNQTTRNRVARQLTEGLGKGESLQQLTDRVAGVLSPNKLGGRKRALSIARTQTASAVSTGRHESFRHATVSGKSWITSGDDHVRDAHRTAGVTYAKPIPLDQPFIVDGESLAYPGDPSGSAKNIANCRCLEIAAALADGKAIDIDRYLTMNFYSYDLMQKTLLTKENS